MERRRLGRTQHESSLAVLGAAAFWDARTGDAAPAFESALAAEPGGIDAMVQKSYPFQQSAARNVGVDEFGRRRLSAWGTKGRREAVGGIL